MNKLHRTRWSALALATVLTASSVMSVPALAADQKGVLNLELASLELNLELNNEVLENGLLENGMTLEEYAKMQLVSLAEEALAGLEFPTEFIMEVPAELAVLDLLECKGLGTFAFAEPTYIPEKGITTCELIFTPEKPEEFHYENILGWNEETKTIHRLVQVYCTSLMTEEEKLAKAAADAAKAAEEAKKEEAGLAGTNANPLPEATVTPEVSVTPEVTVTPEVSVTPEVTVTPEVSVTPEATVTPEASATPEVTVVPEATVTPEVTVAPETTPEESKPVINRTEAVIALEKAIAALSDTVADDAQLNALVEVSKVYDALTAEEKLGLDMEIGKKLVDLQAAAAVYNHTCKGVAVSGNIPWYVALKVELDNDTENYVPTGLETIVPYDISLWDTMNNVKYMLEEGEKATLSMKIPENLSLYDGLKVIHYLNETVYEFIELKLSGEYMSFETASFSPFNIAGSNVLVGGSDNKPGSTTTTPTPTPTATPTAAPTTTPKPTTTTKPTATPTPTTKPSSSTSKNTGKSTSSSSNKNNSGSKTTAAKTGDESQVSRFVMLGMGAAAMLTAAGSILVRRRKTEND